MIEWWVLVLALVVGVVLGTLGGGGAILTVPILASLVGQSAHQATAGSLVIIGLSSLVAMSSHARAKRVAFREGIVFGLLGIVGSYIGSRLAAGVPDEVLMSAFAGLLLVVASVMLRRRLRPPAREVQRRGWGIIVLAATGVGLLTGFFGVGGGFVIVPALTLVVGLGMREAVGTSLLVIAINCASAFASRATHGLDVVWPVVLPFAVLTIVGSLVGGRLSQKVDARALNLAFIVLLYGIAVATGIHYLPAVVG